MTESEAPTPRPRRTRSAEAPPRRRRARRPEFSVGNALASSFSGWFSNFIPFSVLALVIFLPHILFVQFVALPVIEDVQTMEERPDFGTWAVLAGQSLMPYILGLFVQAALIYGVFQHLRGNKAKTGKSLSFGFAAIPAVVGVGLLVGLIFAACFVPALIAMLAHPAFGALMMFVALVFVIMAMCGLQAAVPACVVEGLGITESLARSWHLTKGIKFRIFWLIVLITLINIAIVAVLSVALIAAGGIEYATLFEAIVGALTAPLAAVLATVVYHDARRSKEGIDTDELAKIFE